MKLKKLDLFDKTVIGLLIAGALFGVIILFRKSQFLDVVIRIDQEQVAYSTWNDQVGTKPWYASNIKIGQTEKDGLGKMRAEILNIKIYDVSAKNQALYIKAKIKSTYTKASNTYNFKGRPVAIGEPITLNIDTITLKGVITSIPEIDRRKDESVTLNVEVRLMSQNPVFPNTNGIYDYQADAVKVGDQIKDIDDQPIITVIDKSIKPAKIITNTSQGELLVRSHPILKDVDLILTVNAYKIGSKYFLYEDVPIKIDEYFALNFPGISIYPVITKITELPQ